MKKTLIGAAAAALALPFSAVLLASPGQCRSVWHMDRPQQCHCDAAGLTWQENQNEESGCIGGPG